MADGFHYDNESIGLNQPHHKHPHYHVASTARKKRTLVCNSCVALRKDTSATVITSSVMQSNKAAAEEYQRLRSYLRYNEPVTPSCPNESCAVSIEAIKKNGRTGKGTQRYKCKECGTSFTMEPDTRQRRRSEIDRRMFELLVSGTTLRSIKDILNVSFQTIYHKIDFLHRQCLKFAAYRERKLVGGKLPLESVYIAVDGQTHICNWTNRQNKKNVALNALGSACLGSGYVFAYTFNYDPNISQEQVEKFATESGDADVANCFRDQALVWTSEDYADNVKKSQAAQSSASDEADLIGGQTGEQFDDTTMLPNSGVLVHNEYTMLGHMLLLRELIGHAKKIRLSLDLDSGLDNAALSIFKEEIKAGKCDVFLISMDKSKDTNSLRQGRMDTDKIMREHTGKARKELSGREFREAVTDLIEENLDETFFEGNPKREWLPYPILDKTEHDKAISALTPLKRYDRRHQAHLYRKASLHAIDRFFMQIRRKQSMFERAPASSARSRQIWYGKTPYNPAMFQKLGDIYRVYYNYCKIGEDSRTPAMRMGLAKSHVRLSDIIYFNEI